MAKLPIPVLYHDEQKQIKMYMNGRLLIYSYNIM